MDDARVLSIIVSQYFSITASGIVDWLVVISRRKRMGSVEAGWGDSVWNNLWCRSWW